MLCHVTTESYYNIFDFIAKVSGCPDTIMLIAQTGALSYCKIPIIGEIG